MAETSDRIGVVYAGQIVEEADVKTIFSEGSRHPYTRALMLSVPSLEGPRRRLMSLPGTPFDLRQEPAWCRFVDRCPLAQEMCRRETPPLISVRPGHVSRCHFALEERVTHLEAAISV
jgi:oligopeptide/dipeptide ABC transporter ATP-binding protein